MKFTVLHIAVVTFHSGIYFPRVDSCRARPRWFAEYQREDERASWNRKDGRDLSTSESGRGKEEESRNRRGAS